MMGHPDADTLAACREGLLGRRRSSRIRAHLARCSRCASLDHELTAVSTLLASAPAPRIPDELAARLDTVLATESAARTRGESPAADGVPATADGIPATTDGVPAAAGATASPAGAPDAPAGRRVAPENRAGSRPGRPRTARPPRPWRVTALRAASVTAVLLVIAGGGYGLSRLLHTSGGVSSTSREAGGSSGAGSAVQAPNAGGGSGTGPSRAGNMLGGSGVPVVHSGTDYQPGQLATQANTTLAGYRAKSSGRAASAASPSSFTMDGCLKFAGATRPSLVDEARYGGQSATVIIRAPAGRQPGKVWVIAPSCSAADRHLIKFAELPASG
jgi:hypothetical protein